VRYALRWWETLGKSERIVAMSLTAGSIVAISSSTVWAVAASYIAKQKARVAIAGYARHEQPPAPTTIDAVHGSLSADASVAGVR
jgi:hypothetical protein